MATARVLPSGRWRCFVFVGMEGGKRKYKSFTADTKNDAELEAKQYLADPSRKSHDSGMTVKEAIERYIASKENVLSPATIRGYKAMQKTRYASIENEKIRKLTTETMQRFISDTAKDCKPKYVANVYGLLTASVAMFRPDAVFRTTLPQKPSKRLNSPSNDDVQKLFKSADGDLKICIALAAFGSMRRGEICATRYKDIDGNRILVHADIVMDAENKAVYKDMPKNSDSIRYVTVPPQVIELIGTGYPDDYITHYTPTGLSNAFRKHRIALGIENIRFHDLRHFYASIGVVLQIPEIYLADFGGWKRGSSVLRQTYQNTMTEESEKYSAIMTEHFSDLIDGKKKRRKIKLSKMHHEMHHENEKTL